ncbi:uncharacterized protein LOC125680059 [Ostrea edulis]|uniref:uncharacterized protein LOC125680059 n=1 Tax=Ostrea edulis TaxID=37623 RepID=UPI0024AF5102|nr:uncharacterized protein LOC125680059 [Ostrea edulis]
MEITSRKKNWSEAEIAILVDQVEENKDVLKGKFSTSLSAAYKAATWARITIFDFEDFFQVLNKSLNFLKLVFHLNSINAVGGSGRTLKEVKKKWQDVQSSTKKKEVDRLKIQRQTGGGPPPTDIKEWERKIVGIMSKSVLCGIPGGCDSLVSEIEHVKESEGAICPVDSAAEQPAQMK